MTDNTDTGTDADDGIDPIEQQPKTELEAGTLAYDLTQHEPVVIVDPDVGTVDDQPPAARDQIVKAQGNRAIGFSATIQCAEITYLSMQSTNDSTYTFPLTRLGVPSVKLGPDRLSVRQHIRNEFAKELLQCAAMEDGETVEMLLAALGRSDMPPAQIAVIADDAGIEWDDGTASE